MPSYQLAQLNIGTIKAPLDSPLMADFTNNLDRINALAEVSDGFVWRLKDDSGNATDYRPLDPLTIVNMSVWRDLDALMQYVYKSEHVAIMRRRREWFERMDTAFMVLWWVPAGHEPTVAEALERLEHLRANGESSAAFSFRKPFVAPDQQLVAEA
ncbi:DUF3291 domain-containing protein [Herpetosiphon llansteffanensis]